MKKQFWVLGMATCALLGMTSAAQAATWHDTGTDAWDVAGGSAGYNATIVSFEQASCNTGGGNYCIKTRSSNGTWSNVANGAGIRITRTNGGELWTVTSNWDIYRKPGSTWTQVTRAKCSPETGSVTPLISIDSHSPIAGGADGFVYLIDQSSKAIYHFTGSCWEKLPGGGLALEIAMIGGSSNWPAVRGVDGQSLWHWNGSGWTQINALISNLGRQWVTGVSPAELWQCNPVTQVCSWDSSWNHGGIRNVFDGTAVIEYSTRRVWLKY